MVSIQTPRAVYVAASARTVRAACRAVRQTRTAQQTVVAVLEGTTPNPWIEALARRRA